MRKPKNENFQPSSPESQEQEGLFLSVLEDAAEGAELTISQQIHVAQQWLADLTGGQSGQTA